MITFKQYMQDLMNDRKGGAVSCILKPCLLIISYIYGFLAGSHYFFYKVNLLKSYKSRITTISVGNITLGGTGKTPFVIMLAEYLARKNKKAAVLIRGYGEDEWKMLEDRLRKRGVRVFVGKDRIKSARKAEACSVEALILDDGFQHCRLKRDLDIVLLDSTNPFGNRRLFPRGILREPMGSLERADIMVLTKADRGKENIAAIEEGLRKIAPGKPILKAIHRPTALFDIHKAGVEGPAFIQGKTVCVLSAICDPSYLRYTVEKVGSRVGFEVIFPDHYPYRERDLNRIFGDCKKRNIDTIITTEKDAVKLKKLTAPENGLRILALSVELEITQGKEEIDVRLT
ncbi:MAG: tetraacyldisaccharide 4'-kinase [Candidatus Omnitrophota bacterium]